MSKKRKLRKRFKGQLKELRYVSTLDLGHRDFKCWHTLMQDCFRQFDDIFSLDWTEKFDLVKLEKSWRCKVFRQACENYAGLIMAAREKLKSG